MLTDDRLRFLAHPDKCGPEVVAMALELIEARKDVARLDWLERVGFATKVNSRIEKCPAVHQWSELDGEIYWTAHWISSEFKTARAAIDAALEGK